jgi:type I restriction enzyme R subunit
MSDLHKEINLEDEICEYLSANGWLYAPGHSAVSYDRARALFPEDVIAWLQATQPQAWETLRKNHGPQAARSWSAGLRDALTSGALSTCCGMVSRLLGLRQPLAAGAIQACAGDESRNPGASMEPTGCG